ncbi:tRNA guanosine(34) transglycosylase Tgt [candidate division WWE3 bacterium]|uniref:tRNA guanosine(34) transglycosylase Tgt n=1 Tax=candidate division WWE3 bacterium TaxID=2053526 RepID=A0A7X9DKK0_UNCKA|nr:tRNA guanosine(34) transglycosylase Tgt [candidate division WWE3 bacterium]
MNIKGKTKDLELPAFFPDATHGAVKGLISDNLEYSKTTGVVVNAYHLYIDGVSDKLESYGGIHSYMNFNGLIISDSGGFQVMSLVRRNPKNGKITNDGVRFNINGKGSFLFSPETSIETQIKIGSDIVMCFDDCTEPFESLIQQKHSVERTVLWAERCKKTFEHLTKEMKSKPYLFGIIQGGDNLELRNECGTKLNQIGFDGYAFGGWPVDKNRFLMEEVLKATADLMPNDKPKYAMGVGKPDDIVKCFNMGYNMFDCVLPTRDARHERLYVYEGEPTKELLNKKPFYSYIYIGSGKYANDFTKISEHCDCPVCEKYTKSYIYHLFKNEPNVAASLATIHNLRFYSKLMELL